MMLSLLAVSVLAAPARPQPQKPVTAPVAAGPSRDALAAEAKSLTIEQLVARLRALNQELEFDKLVPFAQELVSRPAVGLEAKREAWLQLATALVILGDPVGAELPFTQLLRVEPQFELPTSVEPKVALVFRKVQAEERELARALRTSQRDSRARGVAIGGERPTGLVGGKPVSFAFALTDPGNDVRAVRVAYRRQGEPSFSTLPLKTGDDGRWRGAIPAELTQSETGFPLEYYVEMVDGEGPLTTEGTPARPLSVMVAAGKLETPWRAPLPRWAFFVSSGLTLAAGAVGTTFFVTYREQQDSFARYIGAAGPLSFQVVEQMKRDGNASAERATIGLISAASMLALTLVIAALTDWRD